MSTSAIIGYVVVPISVFLLTCAAAGIRGAIRFAQHMTRTEAAQSETAKTNQQIADRLGEFMTVTNDKLNDHSERLTVVEYALDTGARPVRPVRVKEGGR